MDYDAKKDSTMTDAQYAEKINEAYEEMKERNHEIVKFVESLKVPGGGVGVDNVLTRTDIVTNLIEGSEIFKEFKIYKLSKDVVDDFQARLENHVPAGKRFSFAFRHYANKAMTADSLDITTSTVLMMPLIAHYASLERCDG